MSFLNQKLTERDYDKRYQIHMYSTPEDNVDLLAVTKSPEFEPANIQFREWCDYVDTDNDLQRNTVHLLNNRIAFSNLCTILSYNGFLLQLDLDLKQVALDFTDPINIKALDKIKEEGWEYVWYGQFLANEAAR